MRECDCPTPLKDIKNLETQNSPEFNTETTAEFRKEKNHFSN